MRISKESLARKAEAQRMGLIPPAKTEKRCRHCGTTKPIEHFPPNNHVRDGRSPWCRACHNAATRDWKARRKEQAS